MQSQHIALVEDAQSAGIGQDLCTNSRLHHSVQGDGLGCGIGAGAAIGLDNLGRQGLLRAGGAPIHSRQRQGGACGAGGHGDGTDQYTVQVNAHLAASHSRVMRHHNGRGGRVLGRVDPVIRGNGDWRRRRHGYCQRGDCEHLGCSSGIACDIDHPSRAQGHCVAAGHRGGGAPVNPEFLRVRRSIDGHLCDGLHTRTFAKAVTVVQQPSGNIFEVGRLNHLREAHHQPIVVGTIAVAIETGDGADDGCALVHGKHQTGQIRIAAPLRLPGFDTNAARACRAARQRAELLRCQDLCPLPGSVDAHAGQGQQGSRTWGGRSVIKTQRDTCTR